MGQVLHGSATTTEAVRRAIQYSQDSLRAPARRYGINPKTVAKWKRRSFVSDLPTSPKEPRSTVLSNEEEAVVIVFPRHLSRSGHGVGQKTADYHQPIGRPRRLRKRHITEGPNTKLLTLADQGIISHDLLPLSLVAWAARITVLLF